MGARGAGKGDVRGAEVSRLKYSYLPSSVMSVADATAQLLVSNDAELRKLLLSTADVLSVLYCRRICMAALTLDGGALLHSEHFLTSVSENDVLTHSGSSRASTPGAFCDTTASHPCSDVQPYACMVL